MVANDDAIHVAILTLSHPFIGHPVERIEMFYPHNGMDYRFNLTADLPPYFLTCFIGHIIIHDTFYIDTEKTHSFYAFGHNHLSTDYSIVHVYSMAGEMKMRMYSSSFAQWSQEQGAPSYIHYFDGAPIVCNGVVYWVDKIIEERPFPRSIVTYSLDAGTWHEASVLEEAKEEIQMLVIHNGIPVLLTHPDHLDEFDANLWYIEQTPTGVKMLENNDVVHNSGFGERSKTIINGDMINIFESVNDIVPFGPNGYLRVVGNIVKINTVTHERSMVRSSYLEGVEKFMTAYPLRLTIFPVCNDELE
ncbi:hypothetical protein PIB30_043323 [Stylosanthes scabra]|uniref:Uncharacterized protein n=1 Tax=Stylosanthes scabra TaxID=79078 RepID=A0ABU6SFU0_9FABA|nr:hypothetical protein [Stylosanthes scabra]